MRAIAIIPARGGSKRIPHKNIKNFCGKPIIAYSIEAARESHIFDKIIVSTDDEQIAEVARKYGAEVPFIRPASLSDDFATLDQVKTHAIEYLKAEGFVFKYLCTLLATAPLLQHKYLIEGYDKLKKSDAHQSFSVTSMPFPIQRTFKITEDNRCMMFFPECFNSRSQDLEEAYQDAGQFYWEDLESQFTDIPFGNDSIPIILPRYLVQDVDTIENWNTLELMYKALMLKQGA